MTRDRNATPILDAVRRQRGECGYNPYASAPPKAYPWNGAGTPDQQAEAERVLGDREPLTLETDT